ncbi:MAG TPA: LPS assembly lipoprotein LptE [Phycisphaerales bacterium]|nr:LPS assembly lipoprotein LptE [Phycisphaerales bacterium]HMP36942.1 LPS assembly lipoprotein LptE [Phycisphaerales bacterium]
MIRSALRGTAGRRACAVGAVLIGGLACALIPAGCASDPTQGYSLRSTFGDDIESIALPIFVNNTFVRNVQFELADALVKEVQGRTPWRVDSSARANTILLGTITDVQIRRIAKSRSTGLAEQDTLTITVDFEWRDQRTGTPIVKRQGFSASGLFVPTITGKEYIELGEWAAIQQLATDIVGAMRTNW